MAIQSLFNSAPYDKYISETCWLLSWYIDLEGCSDIVRAYITKCINEAQSHDDHVSLSELIRLSIGTDDDLLILLKNQVLDYWQDNVQSEIWDTGAFFDYFKEEDSGEICDCAEDFLQEKLKELSIEMDDEIDCIMRFFDAAQIINDNIKNYDGGEPPESDDYIRHDDSGVSIDEKIDDLFERG